MKMKTFLPLAALCMMVASCDNGGQNQLTSGLHLENFDTSVTPGTDFYQYATGGWQKNNPLPAAYSRFGSFDKLAEDNNVRIRGIVEELAAQENPAGSVAQKIGTLYNVVMDSVKLNNDGYEPIKADLEDINNFTDRKSLYKKLAQLSQIGVRTYFGLGVSADDKNSKENAVQMGQGGLSMGQRDYYLEEDEATVRIREAFKSHVVKLLMLCGFDQAKAEQTRDIVMDVETRLAKAFRSRVEMRDPEANYNKISLDDLKKQYPTFEWDTYLSEVGLNGVKEIIVGQPNSLKEAADIINTLPAAQQKLYLQWKLIDAAAGTLSDDIVAENFDFNSRVMRGTTEQLPRWRRAVGVVGSALGEGVGQMYVEKYFPAEAKERMKTLVANLQEALGERIRGLEWMSEETKAKALEKLSTFYVKIGYPDKWRDYSELEIKNDSYWDNMKRVSRWGSAYRMSQFGKPVDRDEWGMTPQTVNAYYNPTTNEICFPAGILQYPFFDMNADDAFNYGAIGVVIGHEMTHGFDDQGSMFDADGNMQNWWQEEDSQKFHASAEKLAAQFDQIIAVGNEHANGHLTLGENIADQGGLRIAFDAFKKTDEGQSGEVIDGFTPEQRFYLSYGRIWAENITDEAAYQQTKSDPHSLGKWRVNATLRNIDTFFEAFGVKAGDKMWLDPADRAIIW